MDNYLEILKNTSDLIHFLDESGHIVDVNPAWLSSLGYVYKEVVGRPIYDFIHPDHRKQYHDLRDKLLKANSDSPNFSFLFISSQQKNIYVEGYIKSITVDEKNAFTRGIFKDITFKKQLEKQAMESHERLRKFILHAPDAVIVANEHQQIKEWNLKAEEIFGYQQAEAINSLFDVTIIPKRFREMHRKGIAHFLKTGEGPILNKTIEVVAIRKNGQEFPISLRISNILLDDQWLFIAFISDITKRKQQEDLLKQQNEHLCEIANIQSHEIRGPLSSILGLMNLIREDGYPPQKEYLNLLDTAVNSLDEKIRQIIQYTHIRNDT